MKTYPYELDVQATNQQEADQKMQALVTILNKLSTEELLKVAEVVRHPAQLAFIKQKLL